MESIILAATVVTMLLSGLENVRLLSSCSRLTSGFEFLVEGPVLGELKWLCCLSTSAFSTRMHVLACRFTKVIYFSLSLKGKLIQFNGT